MPEIGQISNAKEIGHLTNPSARYQWLACLACGEGRWVRLIKGQPYTIQCRPCSYKVLSLKRGGKLNPNWKEDTGNTQTGRSRARRWYKEQLSCAKCGSTLSEHHHVDGNPLNNAPDNIAWLCRYHHMETDKRLNTLKTHCPQGHPYDLSNTYITNGGGRKCRACNREHKREAYYAMS